VDDEQPSVEVLRALQAALFESPGQIVLHLSPIFNLAPSGEQAGAQGAEESRRGVWQLN
jgi:hypothetical protein